MNAATPNQFSSNPVTKELVTGYTELVQDRVRQGWSCHLLTILFPQYPGSRHVILHRMKDQIQRVYSQLLTRVHRRPNSTPNDELPILLACADLPVQKNKPTSAPLVTCNGGVHYHAILLMPRTTRLKEPIYEHFEANHDQYTGSGRLIQKIHIKPIIENHERVVDYLLKTVSSGRIAYDDAVLILPRTRQEISS